MSINVNKASALSTKHQYISSLNNMRLMKFLRMNSEGITEGEAVSTSSYVCLSGQDTWHMDEEVLPVAEAARQLRQRFPFSSQIPAGLVRVGRSSALLVVRLLLHAGVSHRSPAELCPQVHHPDRSARLRLWRTRRPGPTVRRLCWLTLFCVDCYPFIHASVRLF